MADWQLAYYDDNEEWVEEKNASKHNEKHKKLELFLHFYN